MLGIGIQEAVLLRVDGDQPCHAGAIGIDCPQPVVTFIDILASAGKCVPDDKQEAALVFGPHCYDVVVLAIINSLLLSSYNSLGGYAPRPAAASLRAAAVADHQVRAI